MPLYNGFPNLSRQNGNVLEDYYGGLAKPIQPPASANMGTMTGAPSLAQTASNVARPMQPMGGFAPKIGGEPLNPIPTTAGQPNQVAQQTNDQARFRQAIISGYRSGGDEAPIIPANAPDWLRNQYSGSQLPPSQLLLDSQGRQVMMVNEDGSSLSQTTEITDPSKRRWDPDLGWVIDSQYLKDNEKFGINPYMAAFPFVAGMGLTALGAGAAASGVGAGAADLATGVGVGGSAGEAAAASGMGGLGGGAAAAGGGLVPGLTGTAETGLTASIPGTIPASAVTSAAPVAATAGASTPSLMQTLLGTGSGVSGFLNSPAARLIQAGLLNSLNRGNSALNNAAANRADPFDPANRTASNAWLADYLKDPMGTITNSPLYQQGLQQLTQGINRRAAATGYLRTQNPNWDVAEKLPGLVSSVINAYVPNMMQMAGATQPTAPAGNILASNAQNQTNMQGATLGALLSAGGSIIDWLTKQNGV